MTQTITVIPGDGIGPEVTDATLRILQEAGADLDYEEQLAGSAAMEMHKSPLPEQTIESIRRNRVCLKGPLTTPSGVGFRSLNVAIRKEFDLFSNVRPAMSMVPDGRYRDVDLVLFRENTEGLYVGVEHFIGLGEDRKAAAESVMIITRFGSERIVRSAFEYARANGRKKVTLAHKANILKCTQGLFLDVGREVAKDYAGEIDFEDRIVDATAMQLVVNPHQFDVLVMENMFGDILSDLIAGLVGGLGLAPAANIGKNEAVFEAVHGSAPDIAGKGIANPGSLTLSAAMLLDHIGQSAVADRIRNAVRNALMDPQNRTGDLGGNATTETFTNAVINALG